MVQPNPSRGPSARFAWLKYPVFLLLGVAILSGIAVLMVQRPAPTTITLLPPEPTRTLAPTATPGPVTVYVTGAVARPQSLVSVPAGSRVQDVLDAAGGVTSAADLNGVNLGQRVHDGDMVFVPSIEQANGTPTPNHPAVVSINTATAEELTTLPAIGPALAEEIVRYRTQHGPFTRLEDLDAVPGIGPAKLDAIREMVVFD